MRGSGFGRKWRKNVFARFASFGNARLSTFGFRSFEIAFQAFFSKTRSSAGV